MFPLHLSSVRHLLRLATPDDPGASQAFNPEIHQAHNCPNAYFTNPRSNTASPQTRQAALTGHMLRRYVPHSPRAELTPSVQVTTGLLTSQLFSKQTKLLSGSSDRQSVRVALSAEPYIGIPGQISAHRLPLIQVLLHSASATGSRTVSLECPPSRAARATL